MTACGAGSISGTPVKGVSVQLLCYWDLIKWSLDRGLALDLGGAPNEGIRELKTSLGAEYGNRRPCLPVPPEGRL